ncbi:hypothetical protein DRZ78_03770, partial [Candidatus Aerophobetes bacterium]
TNFSRAIFSLLFLPSLMGKSKIIYSRYLRGTCFAFPPQRPDRLSRPSLRSLPPLLKADKFDSNRGEQRRAPVGDVSPSICSINNFGFPH